MSYLRLVFSIPVRCILIALSITGIGFSSVATAESVVVIPMFGDDAASKWVGPWSAGTIYVAGDIVGEGGSSYIALTDHTASLSDIPPAATHWDIVAASGANGLAGAKGDTGATGATGPTGGCVMANSCANGLIDRGLAAILLQNQDLVANCTAFGSIGADFNSSHTFCHTRICCPG